MVRGLAVFQRHFEQFTDKYVLIGGAACDLAMTQAGLEFRATKDLDVVLLVENLDVKFAAAFWAFVRAGRYQTQQGEESQRQYYRFQKPENQDYPFMIELFSKVPAFLTLVGGSHLTPIPLGEDISSLSAILLDDSYYGLLTVGKRVVDGVSVAGPELLIPLKAKAFLDLTARKAHGSSVDAKSIRKHRNDVFRLYQILDPTRRLTLQDPVVNDLREFLAHDEVSATDVRSLGPGAARVVDILDDIRRFYGLLE